MPIYLNSVIILLFFVLNYISANVAIAGISCVDSGNGKKCVANYAYSTSQIACNVNQSIVAYSDPIFNISTVNPNRRITKILLQPNVSGSSNASGLGISKKVGGVTVATQSFSGAIFSQYDLTGVFGSADINGTYNIVVSDDWQYSGPNNCMYLNPYNLIIYYECPGDIDCDKIPDVPKLVTTPASYNYGSVAMGKNSASATYTISNSGKANLTVKEISKTGINPGEFHKASDNCTGKTLDYHSGVNNSCTFTYYFSPETPGNKSANLLIMTDIFKNSLNTIAVSGQATAVQRIQVVPITDTFSEQVPLGSTSSPRFYTVKNIGPGQLKLGKLNVDGVNPADFKVSNDQCSGKILNPTSACTFQASFRPTGQGNKSASIKIPSDDPVAGLLSVSLAGISSPLTQSNCN